MQGAGHPVGSSAVRVRCLAQGHHDTLPHEPLRHYISFAHGCTLWSITFVEEYIKKFHRRIPKGFANNKRWNAFLVQLFNITWVWSSEARTPSTHGYTIPGIFYSLWTSILCNTTFEITTLFKQVKGFIVIVQNYKMVWTYWKSHGALPLDHGPRMRCSAGLNIEYKVPLCMCTIVYTVLPSRFRKEQSWEHKRKTLRVGERVERLMFFRRYFMRPCLTVGGCY